MVYRWQRQMCIRDSADVVKLAARAWLPINAIELPVPAIPVIEMARFAFELLIAPYAISLAVSSETAP